VKIAHVTSTFPPYWAGTGNVAYHNVRALHERGHEVTLFTARLGKESAPPFPFAAERLPSTFCLGNAPFTPGLVGRLRGFDLIHLHYPYIFGAELSTLAARQTRTPLVLTYHNRLQERTLVKGGLFRAYNRTAEPFVLRRAARLCAVTRDHLTSLHPHLQNDPRVSELPNGVDTRHFRPLDKVRARQLIGAPPKVPLALFVGALDSAHRFKNVGGLLKAFAGIRTRDAQLWVVGDGDLKGELEAQAKRLGLRVRFVGKRCPEDLPPFYAAADVSVLPSVAVESFGLVLIESLACGTPVVASNLPGVRTVVAHERDGLLVPPGDAEALREAITTLFERPTWALRLGCHGLLKVRQSYDWASVSDRLERIYEEVLESWTFTSR